MSNVQFGLLLMVITLSKPGDAENWDSIIFFGGLATMAWGLYHGN